MKKIYIDHDEKYNGNGSLNSPFNTLEELYSLKTEHPVTILIKKGNIFRFSLIDLNGIFYNNTSEKSIMSSYGEGSNPVWITKSENNSHIHTNKIQNFTITNIDFYAHENGTQKPYIFGIPTGNQSGDCNLEISQCTFMGTSRSAHSDNGRIATIYLEVEDKRFNYVNKITIKNCHFNFVNSGIYIHGNTTPKSINNNLGDSYKCYGIKIKSCSFTNIINAGILLVACASKNSSYDLKDEYTSGFENIYYSSYRTDVYNSEKDKLAEQAQWDAPIWFTLCNKIIGQYFSIHGSGPGHPDRMAIDFDYHCWDCIIRHGYTSNNSRNVMFISGPMARTIFKSKYSIDKPLDITDEEWYYTRRYGTGNNLYEQVISFNDGLMRDASSINPDSVKINANRYVYNCVIRNCAFIDTISSRNIFIIGAYPTDNNKCGPTTLTIEGCLFYWKFLETTYLINKETIPMINGLKKIIINNTIFYSERWTEHLLNELGLFTINNVIVSDPRFKNLPIVPPVSLDAALEIFSMLYSPSFSHEPSKNILDNLFRRESNQTSNK